MPKKEVETMNVLTYVTIIICCKAASISHNDIPTEGVMWNGHDDGWGWTKNCLFGWDGNPLTGEIDNETFRALVVNGQVHELLEKKFLE